MGCGIQVDVHYTCLRSRVKRVHSTGLRARDIISEHEPVPHPSERSLHRTVKTASRIILAALILSCQAARAGEAERPAPAEGLPTVEKLVQVGAHTITRDELDRFFQAFYLDDDARKQLDGLPVLQREQVLAEGRSKALRELMDRHLLLAEAKDSRLGGEGVRKVVDEMVEQRLKEFQARMGSAVALVRYLHEKGITVSQWKTYTTDGILIQNYVWEKARSGMNLRPDDLRRYYEGHKSEFRLPRRVTYRVIVVDPTGCKTPEEERAKAENILAAIRGGADFTAQADLHSLERDKVKGGLRVVDAPPALPDWLPRLCEGLKEGEVSAAQQTDAGFCIAKLERAEPSRTASFPEVQEQIRETLTAQARREARQSLVERLREGGNVQPYPAGQKMLGL